MLALTFAWTATVLASPAIPPSPRQHVSDRVGVLSPDARRSLSERLAQYEKQAGHQIIVWIDSSSGERTIEQFAVEAVESWGVGSKRMDDGLALFVMVEDRKVRIEVGYGLEARVTDLVSDQVIRTVILPAIEADDWDRAITGGVEALVDTIEGRPGALMDAGGPGIRGPPQAEELDIVEIVFMVVLAVGFVILLITNPRLALMLLFMLGRGGGGGGGGGLGGFRGGGGRSGGGGATGGW